MAIRGDNWTDDDKTESAKVLENQLARKRASEEKLQELTKQFASGVISIDSLKTQMETCRKYGVLPGCNAYAEARRAVTKARNLADKKADISLPAPPVCVCACVCVCICGTDHNPRARVVGV